MRARKREPSRRGANAMEQTPAPGAAESGNGSSSARRVLRETTAIHPDETTESQTGDTHELFDPQVLLRPEYLEANPLDTAQLASTDA